MKTALCEKLGIDHPVVLAPMAGVTNATLVSAVANAGGLGSHGCAATQPDQLTVEIDKIRQATNRPFNLNFFVHAPPGDNAEREERLRGLLQPLFDELGLGDVPAASDDLLPFGPAHLEALLDDPPPIVSFHFGLPAPELLTPLKEKGCTILSTATTVAEAQWLEAHGADVVIAQGSEAGGHQGLFLDDPHGRNDLDTAIGTMALVPQVVDAVSVPVIAAGGIADGRGLAAALCLGAQAAQIGTAFLLKAETNLDPAYRTALSAATGEGTRITRSFSGRPARAIRNRYLETMLPAEGELPDFPVPLLLNAALRAKDAAAGRTDLSSFWAGQAVALAQPETAASFVEDIVEEAQTILKALA